MRRAGVRELRQRASELLRLVQAGETVVVTDRGRPVAHLVPVPVGSALEQMRAAGEIDEATAGDAALPPPLDLPADAPSPSEVLARLRRSER